MENSEFIGTEKARQVKKKVKSTHKTLFYIKEIIHKEFILAGQTINSA
jgi:hypothetical protein